MGSALTARKWVFENFTLLCIGILSGSLLALALKLCWIGFDITDEAYYLIEISDFQAFRGTATNFGALYHPVYKAFDGSLVALRIFNILSIYSLAWVLAYLVLQTRFSSAELGGLASKMLAAGLAAVSLVFLLRWIPSPGYNSLNVIGLLVSSIAVAQLLKNGQKSIYGGSILLGIGGWVVFMAKPSSAALLAVIALAVLKAIDSIRSDKYFFAASLMLSAAVAVCLLAISAILLDGSLMTFIDNLFEGANRGSQLIGNRWFSFDMVWRGALKLRFASHWILWATPLLIIICGFAMWFLARYPEALSGYLLKLELTLIFLIIATVFMIISGQAVNPLGALNTSEMFWIYWLVPISVLLIYLVWSLSHKSAGSPIQRKVRILALFLIMMPYCFTVGTNNNYFASMVMVSIFAYLSIFLLWPESGKASLEFLLRPFVLVLVLICFLALHRGAENPYRQVAPIFSASRVQLQEGPLKGLWVSAATGKYINEIREKSKSAGFSPGDPIIDLTGSSPGTIFALEGKSVGAAWLISGYPGSEKLAVDALKKEPSETIDGAWVLSENLSRSHNADYVLGQLGKDLDSDYIAVATFNVPARLGARKQPSIQTLFRAIAGN